MKNLFLFSCVLFVLCITSCATDDVAPVQDCEIVIGEVIAHDPVDDN